MPLLNRVLFFYMKLCKESSKNHKFCPENRRKEGIPLRQKCILPASNSRLEHEQFLLSAYLLNSVEVVFRNNPGSPKEQEVENNESSPL